MFELLCSHESAEVNLDNIELDEMETARLPMADLDKNEPIEIQTEHRPKKEETKGIEKSPRPLIDDIMVDKSFVGDDFVSASSPEPQSAKKNGRRGSL